MKLLAQEYPPPVHAFLHVESRGHLENILLHARLFLQSPRLFSGPPGLLGKGQTSVLLFQWKTALVWFRALPRNRGFSMIHSAAWEFRGGGNKSPSERSKVKPGCGQYITKMSLRTWPRTTVCMYFCELSSVSQQLVRKPPITTQRKILTLFHKLWSIWRRCCKLRAGEVCVRSGVGICM